MLRANIGLSRKLSKDYNSTGFSVNLDGEILASVADTEAVVERVRELFDVAEEALNRQIEAYESDSAIANRDAEPQVLTRFTVRRGSAPTAPALTNGNGQPEMARTNGNTTHNGNGASEGEAATDKQINFLLNLGKRHRLSTAQLEQRIADTLGHAVGIYDLTKRDAAKVLDALANDGTAEPAGRRR